MSRILAIETSGALCSVGLDQDGNRFEVTHHVDRRHNELLLGMIEEVLDQAGAERSSLTGLAFGCGPGSFTGVRIAAACVQALALVNQLPVLPVPSADALAKAALNSGRVDSTKVLITSIRSRAGHFYLAAFRCLETGLETLEEVRLYDSAQQLPEVMCGDAQLVGVPPDWWPDGNWLDVSATAGDILDIAIPALQQNLGVASAAALPLYVSGDTPWKRVSKS